MKKLIINSATGKNISNLSEVEKDRLKHWVEHNKIKDKAFKDFNPETDVIVKKDIADLKSEMKDLSEMAKHIMEIHAVQTGVKDATKKIDELHAIQTGKLYNPSKEKPKRLSKKEREKQELQQLRKDLHIKWLNQANQK